MPVLLFGLAIWALRIGAPWFALLLGVSAYYELNKETHDS